MRGRRSTRPGRRFFKGPAAYVAGTRAIVGKLRDALVAMTVMTPLALEARGRPELERHVATVDRMAHDAMAIAEQARVPFADCSTPARQLIDRGGADLSWGDGIHPRPVDRRIMSEALLQVWGFGKPDADG